MTTSAVVKFDGGTRPDNPGPSAIGYIVETYDWTDEWSGYIGESANNRTEFRALIQGLELVSEKGCIEVEARGDSEVIVKQVRGEYGVNQPELSPLRKRVQELLTSSRYTTFRKRGSGRQTSW
ncbi:ribonuclease HI family protein [Halorhabdus sp. BNX81]|uniref:ribonuclease HI family protein n=1 Tax=Halorhabdus sp. BNX81 TaxID=2980181 RepID=UPI0023DD388D|nr:ribonuclease HI family protein [Halorhabdus sp. BNX81]